MTISVSGRSVQDEDVYVTISATWQSVQDEDACVTVVLRDGVFRPLMRA